MDTGKAKGFVLYDEVNELLSDEFGGGRELDDLLSELDTAGVDILEEPKLEFDKKLEEGEDLLDLDLAQETGEKTNDPVRMYLREMGTVPLLTREGEIELARRIERGEHSVRKALSRSPLVIREILHIGNGVRRDSAELRELLVLPDLLVSDEAFQEQAEDFVRQMDEIEKYYRKAQQLRQKLLAIPRALKPKQYRSTRILLARTMVKISRLIRAVQFTSVVRRSLAGSLRRAVDQLKPIEGEISRIQRQLEQQPNGNGAVGGSRDLRKELRHFNQELQK